MQFWRFIETMLIAHELGRRMAVAVLYSVIASDEPIIAFAFAVDGPLPTHHLKLRRESSVLRPPGAWGPPRPCLWVPTRCLPGQGQGEFWRLPAAWRVLWCLMESFRGLVFSLPET